MLANLIREFIPPKIISNFSNEENIENFFMKPVSEDIFQIHARFLRHTNCSR